MPHFLSRAKKGICLPQRLKDTKGQRNKEKLDTVFLTGLVFLAKPVCKAGFVAGYCHRPQGRRNGLFKKPAKREKMHKR